MSSISSGHLVAVVLVGIYVVKTGMISALGSVYRCEGNADRWASSVTGALGLSGVPVGVATSINASSDGVWARTLSTSSTSGTLTAT